MVILRTRNKISDFLMFLAWASPFKQYMLHCIGELLNISYISFLLKLKFLNLVNVFEDFMFSGKAFHIITPVYDKDL